MPAPPQRPLTDIWYTYIAGVGGMGVNVVASVLAQAGVRQGYEVRLTNKKGLAIRNGSVYSHLSYSPKGTPVSPLIPCGKADLLLGLDILEAARGLEPEGRYRIAHPERTAAIVNTAKTPTIDTLIGQEDFSAEDQADLIHQHTRPDAYFGANLFRICEHYLGNKLYANIMMLGVAFQRGLLSLDLDTLLWAIGQAVRRDLETNLKAFNMGRYLALDPTISRSTKNRLATPSSSPTKLRCWPRRRASASPRPTATASAIRPSPRRGGTSRCGCTT